MAMPSSRLTTDEFERMIDAGVLGPDDHVELIEGELVEMSPIGAPHAACVNRLTALFIAALGTDVIVQAQGPIHLGDISRPQPDLAVFRYRDDFYAEALPRPADVLLVVEVADTSAGYDRVVKLPLYAAAGIAEAWVVDLKAGAVDVATDPSPQGYATVHQATHGATLTPTALPSLTLDVAHLLGT